jgi:hypothetical protein
MIEILVLFLALVFVLIALALFVLRPAASPDLVSEIDEDEGEGEAALAEQVWAQEATRRESEDGRYALRRLAAEWSPPRESDMIRRLREWTKRQDGDAS